MPTYEYQCDACGAKFELFQSITSKPIKKCPECSKRRVRRLIGAGAGIIFKGSGFYVTDSKKPDAAATPPAPREKGGSETRGETKQEGTKKEGEA